MPTTPISEKRLAANRANAARSTGPRSEEGKARSAQNALKHGITAAKFAVPELDEPDAFANLRADAVALYQPSNSQELFAVERIVLAQLALLRCAALEASLYSASLEEPPAPEDAPEPSAGNRQAALGRGFQRQLASWSLFLRYQAQTERQYRRAIEDLERLKMIPQDLPNEPTAPAKLEDSTDLEKLLRLPARLPFHDESGALVNFMPRAQRPAWVGPVIEQLVRMRA